VFICRFIYTNVVQEYFRNDTTNKYDQEQNIKTETSCAFNEPIKSHALGELAGSRQTLLHSPAISSWPPSWKYGDISEIRLRQSMRSYLKNKPTKFYPNPIWNDEAL